MSFILGLGWTRGTARNSTLVSRLLRDCLDNLFNRLLCLVVGDAARADDFVAAAAVVFEQLADGDVGSGVEDVVAYGDNPGVFSLRVLCDFHLPISFVKYRDVHEA